MVPHDLPQRTENSQGETRLTDTGSGASGAAHRSGMQWVSTLGTRVASGGGGRGAGKTPLAADNQRAREHKRARRAQDGRRAPHTGALTTRLRSAGGLLRPLRA